MEQNYFFLSFSVLYIPEIGFFSSVGVILCTEINVSSENTRARHCNKKQENHKKTCMWINISYLSLDCCSSLLMINSEIITSMFQ